MSNADTAKAMLRATTFKDLEAVVAMFDPRAVFAQPFSLHGPHHEYSGVEEIRRAFEEIFVQIDTLAYRKMRITEAVGGLAVFVEAEGDMTLAGSGRPYENTYVFRFDFCEKSNLIRRLTEYMNSYYLSTVIHADSSQHPS